VPLARRARKLPAAVECMVPIFSFGPLYLPNISFVCNYSVCVPLKKTIRCALTTVDLSSLQKRNDSPAVGCLVLEKKKETMCHSARAFYQKRCRAACGVHARPYVHYHRRREACMKLPASSTSCQTDGISDFVRTTGDVLSGDVATSRDERWLKVCTLETAWSAIPTHHFSFYDFPAHSVVSARR
jgi:hypothetical protein